MSKPRLTKEEKKIRKELIKYHKNLPANKDARKTAIKVGASVIATALLIQELMKGKD